MQATIIPHTIDNLTTYGIGLVTDNGTRLLYRISFLTDDAATLAAIDLIQSPFQEKMWDLINDETIIYPKGA